MQLALLVELKEEKQEQVHSLGNLHGYHIALPIASAISRYANKLTANNRSRILFILSPTGIVQATYFGSEANLTRKQNAESYIFFVDYDEEAFTIEWKNVSKNVMERILNIEINIEDFPENYNFHY
jgi:hypothetical protein